MQQCSRFLKTVDNKAQYAELRILQKALDNKIKIVSPALDLIEFRSGRGNVLLGNAASLTKGLHRDIVSLGKRLERAAATEELYLATGSREVSAECHRVELLGIINDIKLLLARIDGDIPFIQLAITASGESLSTSLPATISPSRLLQASMFLTVGDTQFNSTSRNPTQIGPSFTLSLYMLFISHCPSIQDSGKQVNSLSDKSQYGGGVEDVKKAIWQEVVHKARVRLIWMSPDWVFDQKVGDLPKTPSMTGSGTDFCSNTKVGPFSGMDGYSYHLEITEDLDDGRVHEAEDQEMRRAGIRESIPIHQISKIFYTDTGRILNIGETTSFESNAVLLLKRDSCATVPTSALDHIKPQQDVDTETGPCRYEVVERHPLLTSQGDIDRQLRREAGYFPAVVEPATTDKHGERHFPRHLDPEWLALEVFIEDDDVGSDEDAENGVGDEDEDHNEENDLTSDTLEQIRHLSMSGTEPAKSQDQYEEGHADLKNVNINMQDTCYAGNPGEGPPASCSLLGTAASSLSLLEMLIRLTSLQEFQQVSHLSLPDHILTFFLEESSTTGLCGEEQWKAKKEAKQRMGFDPYIDTPKS
ncbi:ranGTP-binding protein [Grosmannia clavigera kw1407]|uniref:RanGTP-binding protein n=1 Tax=Grosmannia clavigera (strain kw1407 / UAMH 11150) TaxID=655863 RepID=F0XNY6_GROCL|nr:ranGTP-binding protein [Grosmannia clavigera kw1407]EFX00287.1 ranGTP-binding protein [Grosmannia clavigera kw1407]